MSRSTKLFQRPGSPLIQGHSKMERAFFGEWVRGLLACWVIGFAVYVYLGLDPQRAFGLQDVWEAAIETTVRFMPGAALGAAFGVPVARGFGWRRHWQTAAVFGLAAGAMTLLVLNAV